MLIINKVSAGRGAAWVNESISTLKNSGKAIWIPALIIGLLSALPYIGAFQALFTFFFYGGLTLCMQSPNGGYDAFSGFKNGNFGRILPILMLHILFAVIITIAFWPLVLAVYDMWQSGQTQMDPKQAEPILRKVFIHFTWILPIAIYLSWMTQFAIPLVTIGGLSGKDAIVLGSKAVFTNLGAVFVNGFCLTLVMIIIMIVCMIPTFIFGIIFAAQPTLLELALFPITALMMTVALSLMSANMLQAYRDIFTDNEPVVAKDTEVLL